MPDQNGSEPSVFSVATGILMFARDLVKEADATEKDRRRLEAKLKSMEGQLEKAEWGETGKPKAISQEALDKAFKTLAGSLKRVVEVDRTISTADKAEVEEGLGSLSLAIG